ncbi:LysR family transcriptional regulator [Stappia sp. 22II-S9-Z10]|nr:LysR family transcriptional regulator [Stappia sp. 22II-S9-Z10]
MIENRLILSFIQVAETLHFGKAAEQLNIAQPALSRQIMQLEERLQVQLLERTQRRVALTPAGDLFLRHAYRIAAELERALTEVRRLHAGATGHVCVGFIHSATFSVLPALLQRFRAERPGVVLDLQEMGLAALQQALIERRVDVAVTRPPLDRTGVAHHLLSRQAFVLAVPAGHRLAEAAAAPLAAVEGEDLIVQSSCADQLAHARITAMCEAAGFMPRLTHAPPHFHTIMALVGAGMGVAIVPEAARATCTPAVRCLPITDAPASSIHLVLAWRTEETAPAVRRFVELAVSGAPD